ncbi:unnamed protein product [Colias eurytheme]|nr:unnamed protein product [Colias eurytheme]
MLVVRGNRDENEYIDGVYKFSGKIRNNMDPSDARKLDYGRSTVPLNSHEYVIPGAMQYHDVYQPYTVKHLNNGRETFFMNILQKSQEGTEYTDKQQEHYVNNYPKDRDLIQHMKKKYNENTYQHDQENIHALQSPRGKSPYFDNTGKLENYDDDNYSYGHKGGYDPYDNVAVTPNLNILYNSKESQLPSQTKWLNSNTKFQQLYHPYGKEIHFDDR